ncbi:unnamed protein product [Effrenium voratum]|nr:unnamed protein product [Effrenium voratum]|mmetsp:Transcript_87493/g.209291  ORF Transcript_87493/g.209291 Transcript_87493/m.209291 type:complete len:107 (+) Transcript_87493:58-378(+)|eukprot:CAMPEP_0181477376 /NCGR_PEP_ID=MMETSP1110-20121109/42185_1 /TAXON_ID=174948 /ORGANISM="Symbiodinium sp., Strain CCMP421" /LENGTH=106 /DNA_ID=CAMNT_0023602677 /DNA_START=34 /DNA_END=354 /DNA_ORIENTATION=-
MAVIAERVNGKLFGELAAGSAARVLGQCSKTGDSWVVTASDGTTVQVSPSCELADGLVELCGTKGQDGELCAASVCRFPGEADMEVWDKAINLTHTPQLRHLFQPA